MRRARNEKYKDEVNSAEGYTRNANPREKYIISITHASTVIN